MRKSLTLFSLTILLLGLVSGAMIQSYWQTAFVKISGQPEDPLEAWSEADVIVWQYNSTFYASRNMSTLMVIDLTNNSTEVINNQINNLTANGGCIWVKTGAYAANVILKTKIRLIIDQNATGITVTLNSGATALLEDYSVDRARYWKAGVLTWDSDMDAGTLSVLNAVFSGWVNSTSIDGDNYYLGNQSLGFVEPATFIIDVSGSTYRMWYGANSTLAYSNTNASQVINYAAGNLTHTYDETVYLKGNITITNTLLVYSHETLLIDGNVTLASSSNCDMIRNVDVVNGNSYVTVHGVGQGATLDGKSLTQTSGNGVVFNASSGSFDGVEVSNLKIFNYDDSGILMWASGKVGICRVEGNWVQSDVSTGGDGESGCVLLSYADGYVQNNVFQGNLGYALEVAAGGGDNVISDNYLGGGSSSYPEFYLNSANCEVSDLRVDSGKNAYGLMNLEHLASGSHFSNIHVTRPVVASLTAIYLDGVQNTTWTGLYIGQKWESDDTAYDWLYGIQEVGTSGYNLYGPCNIQGCTNTNSTAATSHIFDSLLNSVWYP